MTLSVPTMPVQAQTAPATGVSMPDAGRDECPCWCHDDGATPPPGGICYGCMCGTVVAPTPRTPGRARGMGADALCALSDYAHAIMRRDDARARGQAAHTAGRAVLDLAAYAEVAEEYRAHCESLPPYNPCVLDVVKEFEDAVTSGNEHRLNAARRVLFVFIAGLYPDTCGGGARRP